MVFRSRGLVAVLVLTAAVLVAFVAAGNAAPTQPVTGTISVPSTTVKPVSLCSDLVPLERFRGDVRHAYRVHDRPFRRHGHLAFLPSRAFRRLDGEARCQQPPSTRRRALRVWHREYLRAFARYEASVESVPSPEAACIIRKESGGDPRADNGSHFGIAQWSISSWLGGGGGRFGSSPLDASYAQQVQILNSMLPGQQDQWLPYEPGPPC